MTPSASPAQPPAFPAEAPPGFVVSHLSQMVRGWFVGDFEPVVLRTAGVEVAVQHYPAGAHEAWHVHKIATEITVIVSGRARMNGREFGPGEIIHIQPGHGTDFEALEDTVTTVVKLPSVKGDKYVMNPPTSLSPHA
jgi:mannose-6-phosphate isomerase-like protein (cupin superfamily)